MVLNNLDDKDNSFEDKIFDLFQIDEVDEDFDSSGIVFHYFFNSFIPAIMSGFITNWWLEDRYCNDKGDSSSLIGMISIVIYICKLNITIF